MITVSVFSTNSDEFTLFTKLLGRGRYASTPLYQSVERFYPEDGSVLFQRLDCAPAEQNVVGVAGCELVTTQRFEAEVKNWLQEWNIRFSIRHQQVTSPNEVRTLYESLRAETADGRPEIQQRIFQKLRNE
jgi:hypothetical protein